MLLFLPRINIAFTQLLHREFSRAPKQLFNVHDALCCKIRINLRRLQKAKNRLHKSCGMALWTGCIPLKIKPIKPSKID